MPSRQRYVSELREYLKASMICFWRADEQLAARPVVCSPADWIRGVFLVALAADGVELLLDAQQIAGQLPLAARVRATPPPQALLVLRRGLDAGGALGVYVAWERAGDMPQDLARHQTLIELVLDVLLRSVDAAPVAAVAGSQMRSLAAALPQGVALVSPDAALGYVNAGAAALLDLPAGEIAVPALARALQAMLERADNAAHIRQQVQPLLDGGGGEHGGTEVWHFPNGRPRALRVTLAPLRGERSQVWAWLFDDVSAEVDQQQQLMLSAEAFALHSDGVVLTDAGHHILTANDAFVQACGYSREELRGQRPVLLRSGRHDEAFYRDLRAQLLAHGWWQGGIWNRARDGSLFFKWLSIEAVRGPHGDVTHYTGIYRDVARVRKAQSRVEYLATHDELTRLPNRILFIDHLQTALQRHGSGERRVGVLALELRDFQALVNVTGSGSAQEWLKQAARRVVQHCPPDFLVARSGETRFAVHGRLQSPQELQHLGERLVGALSEPLQVGTSHAALGAAVGTSLFPDDDAGAEQLLLRAEAALQRACQPGAPAVQRFSADMAQALRDRFALEQGLRQALAGDQLFLVYQPQLRADDGSLHGCEALLRWRRDDGTLLSPAAFIPAAEHCGLIAELTHWVLRHVCEQLRDWDSQQLEPGMISVNLSAMHFQLDDMVSALLGIMHESGVSPRRVCLEITESAMADPVSSRFKVDALKQAGFAVSVDDFGTGFSSLAYLKRFAFDELKVDRSFVNGIENDDGDRAIVSTIVSLAHSLGLRVVAEGVENPRQVEFLRDKGCDFMQGYWFARPMPAQELGAWMRRAQSA